MHYYHHPRLLKYRWAVATYMKRLASGPSCLISHRRKSSTSGPLTEQRNRIEPSLGSGSETNDLFPISRMVSSQVTDPQDPVYPLSIQTPQVYVSRGAPLLCQRPKLTSPFRHVWRLRVPTLSRLWPDMHPPGQTTILPPVSARHPQPVPENILARPGLGQTQPRVE